MRAMMIVVFLFSSLGWGQNPKLLLVTGIVLEANRPYALLPMWFEASEAEKASALEFTLNFPPEWKILIGSFPIPGSPLALASKELVCDFNNPDLPQKAGRVSCSLFGMNANDIPKAVIACMLIVVPSEYPAGEYTISVTALATKANGEQVVVETQAAIVTKK